MDRLKLDRTHTDNETDHEADVMNERKITVACVRQAGHIVLTISHEFLSSVPPYTPACTRRATCSTSCLLSSDSD